MRMLRQLFLMVLLLFTAAGPAQVASAQGASAQDSAATIRAWELSHGEERILRFLSEVMIEPSGDLDVTETIRLVSLGQEINHGIQRDFPTSYVNPAGQRSHVGFQVLSVQRDGHDEPWERLSLSNGVRIRIGSADVILPPAEHVFSIRYRTTRQMIYAADHDELYWNVTGNGWTFPIDVAEARITLPAPAAFGNRAVYTGPQGSTAHQAQVIDERPGYIAFRTTAPLGREEGLTIAAAFPKGVLTPPDSARRAGWWLQDWGALSASLLAVIGLIGYYFRAWWKAGRGPRAGTVVPIFTPPDGLSPAAMRYISRMSFDNRAFCSALVDLGVRGTLHIAQQKGHWLTSGTTTLSRTEPKDKSQPLPAAEASMGNRLFSGGQSIELKQENHATLQAARSALESGLKSAYEGVMFRKNSGWAYYGLLLLLLSMLAIAVIALLTDSSTAAEVRIGFPLLAALLLGGGVWLHRAGAGTKGCTYALIWAVVIGLGIAGAAAALGTIVSALAIGTFTIFVPLLLLPVALSAFRWMYAPTQEGRAVMDRIAGFRQYLSITEEARLEAMHPPEKTPELFERYLPYAIALDVENRWAERFSDVLAAAAAAGATAQTVGWYSGSGDFWNDPTGFVSDIGSSFASTVSSAATSPSSSDGGSSGGGSSGGGGGGGGGSGW